MMIVNYPKCLSMSRQMAKMLRKNKIQRDWIFYCNTERDPIPAAIFASCFPGSLLAPASPGLMHNISIEVLNRSLLFSVVAEKTMFDIWEAVWQVLHVPMVTVAFFKLVDDPRFWLEILIREEVKFEW